MTVGEEAIRIPHPHGGHETWDDDGKCSVKACGVYNLTIVGALEDARDPQRFDALLDSHSMAGMGPAFPVYCSSCSDRRIGHIVWWPCPDIGNAALTEIAQLRAVCLSTTPSPLQERLEQKLTQEIGVPPRGGLVQEIIDICQEA